jgi:hypothetical protein
MLRQHRAQLTSWAQSRPVLTLRGGRHVRLLGFSPALRPSAEATPRKKAKKRKVAKRMIVKLAVVCQVNELALYPLPPCGSGTDAYAEHHSAAWRRVVEATV